MAWDKCLRWLFTRLPDDVHPSEFNGPYLSLLTSLFPLAGKFLVASYYNEFVTTDTEPSECPPFIFEIFKAYDIHPGSDRTVFVLQMNGRETLQTASARANADDAFRKRLVDMSENCNLPVLHGVSAMGTRLCFYTLQRDTGIIEPRRIEADPELQTDTVPLARWDCDLLEEEGERRLRAVAGEIEATT